MKRLVLFLAIAAFGLFVTSLPRPTVASNHWPPLLNCPDVNADGAITVGDIGLVVGKFGTFYPNADYLLLYDVNGGGGVTVGDITKVVIWFGQACPLIDTQVAQATLAMTGAYGGPDLRDPTQATQDAFACNPAGSCPLYIKSSQNVPAMGIHLFSPLLMADWSDCCSLGQPGEPGESQLIHPVGLVYTAGAGGGPDELIGAWYIQPNDEVCAFYGISTPCQSNSVQPVGFGLTNTDEDNDDPPGIQAGWHSHSGLCIWNWGETNASVFEGLSQENCEGTGGIWFSTYGWMIHLYNFIPNPDGRFMKWNTSLP